MEVVRTPEGYKTLGGGDAAPQRAILPNFDSLTSPGPPLLTHKVGAVGAFPLVVKGKNLTGIVGMVADVDVKVGGNSGPAPVPGALTVTDTSVGALFDASGSAPGDMWGILLTDADGNVYAAPSPARIVTLG